MNKFLKRNFTKKYFTKKMSIFREIWVEFSVPCGWCGGFEIAQFSGYIEVTIENIFLKGNSVYEFFTQKMLIWLGNLIYDEWVYVPAAPLVRVMGLGLLNSQGTFRCPQWTNLSEKTLNRNFFFKKCQFYYTISCIRWVSSGLTFLSPEALTSIYVI